MRGETIYAYGSYSNLNNSFRPLSISYIIVSCLSCGRGAEFQCRGRWLFSHTGPVGYVHMPVVDLRGQANNQPVARNLKLKHVPEKPPVILSTS